MPPVEGKSLIPILQGQERAPHDVLYWEHTGHRAVREGDWKLVAERGSSDWELYNIREDRTELHDLSKEKPEMTLRLRGIWESWAEDVGIVPWEEITRIRQERRRAVSERN